MIHSPGCHSLWKDLGPVTAAARSLLGLSLPVPASTPARAFPQAPPPSSPGGLRRLEVIKTNLCRQPPPPEIGFPRRTLYRARQALGAAILDLGSSLHDPHKHSTLAPETPRPDRAPPNNG